MGNSNGNLIDLWNLVYENPSVQGGCIWDWVDQGLLTKSAAGEEYFGYGGDFEPDGVYHDGNFCANGLVSADRTPHPALWEVKKMYQYVRIKPVDIKNLTFAIKNYHDFTNLRDYQVSWDITANGENFMTGRLPVLDLEPQGEQVIKISDVSITPESNVEYHISFTTTSRNATELVDAGHVVAVEQFKLPFYAFAKCEQVAGSRLTVERTAEYISISGKDFRVGFDIGKGVLSSYSFSGKELIKSGPEINFWRAPTDNDFGNEMPQRCKVWKQAGKNRTVTFFNVQQISAHEISVTFVYDLKEIESSCSTTYRVKGNGDLVIQNEFEPGTLSLPALPRFGMNMSLFEQYE